MGLFSRFKRIVKSNFNQAISKAEKPEKVLDQIVDEMNEQLIESKRSVAGAIADEKRLERRVHEYQKRSAEWEGRAILAIQAVDKEPDRKEYYENLARKALVQKKELCITADKYQEQVTLQHDSVEKLKAALQDLQQRVEEARRKKNLLIARAKQAEAHKKIQEQIKGLIDTSAFKAFDKMAAKVEQIETEIEAVNELDTAENTTLEKEFTLLEYGNNDKKMLDDLRERSESIDKNSSDDISDNKSTDESSISSDIEIDSMMKELQNRLKSK